MDSPASPHSPQGNGQEDDLSGYRGLPGWLKPFPWKPRKRTTPPPWRKNPRFIYERGPGTYVWRGRKCRWPGCSKTGFTDDQEWCYYHWRMIPNRLRSMLGDAFWQNPKINESDGSTVLYRYRAHRVEEWIRKYRNIHLAIQSILSRRGHGTEGGQRRYS